MLSSVLIWLLTAAYILIIAAYLFEHKYSDAIYWFGATIINVSFLVRRT